MCIISDRTTTEKMKESLNELYQRHYMGGKCACYDECAKGSETVEHHCSYAAKVGSDYALKYNGQEIRIVIVGKEGKEEEKENEKKALKEPERLKGWIGVKGGVNPHYRETFKILCEMLNYNKGHGNFCYRDDPVLTTFTLTNLYRCDFRKKGKVSNTTVQTENCLKLLRKELDILKPTVLVLQCNSMTAREIYNKKNDSLMELKEISEKFYYNPNENCYIIEMVHPRNAKLWYNESVPRLKRAVEYLQQEGKLPSSDTTALFNSWGKS